MTFGGGPLNNATFQALARMVPMLRDAPGTTGLLTFISGIITKHGISVWSTTPPEHDGFAYADTSAAVAAGTPALEVVGDHHGVATDRRRTPSRTRAASRATPRSSRPPPITVASSPATTTLGLAADMAADEWCGRDVTVEGDRFRVGD